MRSSTSFEYLSISIHFVTLLYSYDPTRCKQLNVCLSPWRSRQQGRDSHGIDRDYSRSTTARSLSSFQLMQSLFPERKKYREAAGRALVVAIANDDNNVFVTMNNWSRCPASVNWPRYSSPAILYLFGKSESIAWTSAVSPKEQVSQRVNVQIHNRTMGHSHFNIFKSVQI